MLQWVVALLHSGRERPAAKKEDAGAFMQSGDHATFLNLTALLLLLCAKFLEPTSAMHQGFARFDPRWWGGSALGAALGSPAQRSVSGERELLASEAGEGEFHFVGHLWGLMLQVLHVGLHPARKHLSALQQRYAHLPQALPQERRDVVFAPIAQLRGLLLAPEMSRELVRLLVTCGAWLTDLVSKHGPESQVRHMLCCTLSFACLSPRSTPTIDAHTYKSRMCI